MVTIAGRGATPEVYVDLMVIFMGPRLATGSSPLENFRNHLGKNIVNQLTNPSFDKVGLNNAGSFMNS